MSFCAGGPGLSFCAGGPGLFPGPFLSAVCFRDFLSLFGPSGLGAGFPCGPGRRLYLPISFLEDISWLLEDKKQVVFQGPPGTGKTYVARELAGDPGGFQGPGHPGPVPPVLRLRGLRAGLSPRGVRAGSGWIRHERRTPIANRATCAE